MKVDWAPRSSGTGAPPAPRNSLSRRRKAGAARVARVMRTLARAIGAMSVPAVEKISEAHRDDPFRILISTLLSARTQDATTHAASRRLFRAARTPRNPAGRLWSSSS